MKTYTFFYREYEEIDKIELKKYIVSASRLDSALKAFSNFILLCESEYISFFYTYNVFNGHRTQTRSLSFSDIVFLSGFKDKHNSKMKEENN